MEDKRYGNGQLMRDVVGGITVAVVLWIAASVVELRELTAKTEGNRWTSIDQSNYAREIQRTHNEIWGSIITLRESIPKEIPPEWFRDKVEDLEDRVKLLENQMKG